MRLGQRGGKTRGRGCPGGGRTRGNKLGHSSPVPEVTAAPLAGRYWAQPVKQQSGKSLKPGPAHSPAQQPTLWEGVWNV